MDACTARKDHLDDKDIVEKAAHDQRRWRIKYSVEPSDLSDGFCRDSCAIEYVEV